MATLFSSVAHWLAKVRHLKKERNIPVLYYTESAAYIIMDNYVKCCGDTLLMHQDRIPCESNERTEVTLGSFLCLHNGISERYYKVSSLRYYKESSLRNFKISNFLAVNICVFLN